MSIAATPPNHGVGFLNGNSDADLRISSYEERASIYERLGIIPSNESINGHDYYWNKDDPTLRAMAERYRKVYAPQIAEKVRALNHDPLRGAIASTDIGTLPLFLDSGFFDLTPKDVIVAKDLRRTPWQGKTVNWNSQSGAGAAVFAASENPAIADQDNTYIANSQGMSVIYGKMTLTGLGMAVAEPFVNLMNYEIQRRMTAVMELIEATTLTGDGTGGSWEGMQAKFTTNVESIGGAITLDDIDTLLRKTWNSGGNPDRAIAPHQTVNDIGAILRDTQRTTPESAGNIGGWRGLRNFVTYNGIPVFGSRFMPDTPGAREAYWYQQDILDYPTLLDVTVEPLAKVGDAETWLLKTYMTFRDRSADDGTGGGGVFHGKMETIA